MHFVASKPVHHDRNNPIVYQTICELASAKSEFTTKKLKGTKKATKLQPEPVPPPCRCAKQSLEFFVHFVHFVHFVVQNGRR
jgi:hypothetical protein